MLSVIDGDGDYKVSHSWQVWWHILVIIEKLKQEGYKLESILGYITRYCLKDKQKNKTNNNNEGITACFHKTGDPKPITKQLRASLSTFIKQ